MVSPDGDAAPSILTTDPAMVLVSLGAFVGLLAAGYWLKVFRAVEPSGAAVTGGRSDLSSAALFTGVSLFLMCGGFLFGRFTGRF